MRKVELYLGDLAQRMCPLMPSSKDFVHKVPHLFFDLAQWPQTMGGMERAKRAEPSGGDLPPAGGEAH